LLLLTGIEDETIYQCQEQDRAAADLFIVFGTTLPGKLSSVSGPRTFFRTLAQGLQRNGKSVVYVNLGMPESPAAPLAQYVDLWIHADVQHVCRQLANKCVSLLRPPFQILMDAIDYTEIAPAPERVDSDPG
jgi:NAD-dependent SIR2 family protein deacetylase